MPNKADTYMYDYAKQIRPPHDVGITDKGTWDQVGKNIQGLESYFQVLSKGGGKASKVAASARNGGMGNRYFVPAMGNCSNEKPRYIYMDHVPTKRSAQSFIFSEEVGFIPGLTNNVLQAMDPDNIVNAVSGEAPECVEVELTQVNSIGQPIGAEKRWVSESDARDIDACWFSSGTNKYADDKHKTCKDSFANISDTRNMALTAAEVPEPSIADSVPSTVDTVSISMDTLEILYVMMLSGVGLYALHRMSSII
jgi:hypothetical protein